VKFIIALVLTNPLGNINTSKSYEDVSSYSFGSSPFKNFLISILSFGVHSVGNKPESIQTSISIY